MSRFDFVRVRFPESPLEPERVYSMNYYQNNYMHDFAELQFRDWNIDPRRIKRGTPMEITLDGKVLSGYVHDIQPKINSRSSFTKVNFIGASYVMRQQSQELYRNVSADQVIRKIAIKYGFSYRVEPHPRVYPQISQAGMTDWEFMVKLAKQSGYFLRAEGTSIYFLPLRQEFDELISEMLTFTQVDAGFKSENMMYEFKARIGETLFKKGANKNAIAVAGVDYTTGKPFKYTKPVRSETTRSEYQPELFDEHATEVVANNYQIGVYEAVSADENSKFPYKAEALVLGTSYVRPGMPVFIDTGSDEYTGPWTILGVEHQVVEEKLNMQKFTSTLILGSDSLGKPAGKYPERPPSRRFRTISPGIRNTRIKPNSVIKRSNIKVKTTHDVSLVERINRPAPAGKNVSKTVWASDVSDLKTKPTVPGRSPAALIKVASYLAR